MSCRMASPSQPCAHPHPTAPFFCAPPGFFKYIKWALHDFNDAPLHTNNQLLSLTDQLNLGVRSLELDTHWVGGLLGTGCGRMRGGRGRAAAAAYLLGCHLVGCC